MELVDRPAGAVWLSAVRPGFLTAIVLPVLVGASLAYHVAGVFEPSLLAVSVLAAASAHAGANVLNDFYDHLSGADALNTDPLSPFAGGSRMIQKGLMTPTRTLALGWVLTALAAALGLALVGRAGPGLLLIGALGLALGYAYTAPPLRLSYRGLGEVAVFLAFGPLAVAGAYLVQAARLDAAVGWPGAAMGFLTAAILYVNQFPDCDADALAGKRTLVVRLGLAGAARWYPLWPLLAALALLGGVLLGQAPTAALVALVPLALSALAGRGLVAAVQGRGDLRLSIKATLAAHSLVGLALVLAYALAGPARGAPG